MLLLRKRKQPADDFLLVEFPLPLEFAPDQEGGAAEEPPQVALQGLVQPGGIEVLAEQIPGRGPGGGDQGVGQLPDGGLHFVGIDDIAHGLLVAIELEEDPVLDRQPDRAPGGPRTLRRSEAEPERRAVEAGEGGLEDRQAGFVVQKGVARHPHLEIAGVIRGRALVGGGHRDRADPPAGKSHFGDHFHLRLAAARRQESGQEDKGSSPPHAPRIRRKAAAPPFDRRSRKSETEGPCPSPSAFSWPPSCPPWRAA